MNNVSKRIANLAAAQTLAMAQKSSELKSQGVDVISLSLGEPDFNTPDHIKAAAHAAIDGNFSFYPPVGGYASLKKAICEKLRRDNRLTYSPDEIVVSGGAKQSVCNAVLSIVNPGDEVIIPTPAWVSYVEMVKLAEGKAVEVFSSHEQGFKLTAEQLEAAITDRTVLLILCSPSNPTGSVYTKDELESLAAVLRKHPQVMVISDEVYEHINYVGEINSIVHCDGMRERCAIVNGVSKTYAMTGWRIGFMAAPQWLAKACTKLQGQYTSAPSSIAQKAAEEAFIGPQECVAEMREAFRRRRDLVVSMLREIPDVEVAEPAGAFYVFPLVEKYIGRKYGDRVISTGYDLAIYLLEVGHVATVDGAAFCAPGYLRLSYATSEETLREAISRIKSALSVLE